MMAFGIAMDDCVHKGIRLFLNTGLIDHSSQAFMMNVDAEYKKHSMFYIKFAFFLISLSRICSNQSNTIKINGLLSN